ncbi:MAG TPA: hypothetical protein VFB82_21675, partial [Blastocatellia bacterium]|nr:hypothetical protein [Blastocatellia bacterium]
MERDPNLRGVLLIDTRSSPPIREYLREDVLRLGDGRTDQLKAITKAMIKLFQEREIKPDKQLFSRFRIVIKDLDEGRDGHTAAQAYLRQIVDPANAQKVWTRLCKEGVDLISRKGRRDISALQSLLAREFQLAEVPASAFQRSTTEISERDLLQANRELLEQIVDLRSDFEKAQLIPAGQGLGHVTPPPAGDSQRSSPPLLQTVLDVAASLPQIVSDISRDKFEQVEHARELYRQGKGIEATNLVSRIREQTTWPMLPNEVKGVVLRLAASLALNTENDLAKARSLATEAQAIDSQGDSRIIRALISLREEGPERALSDLSRPDNVNGFNLRLHLMLLLGRSDDVIALANNPHDSVVANGETMRL